MLISAINQNTINNTSTNLLKSQDNNTGLTYQANVNQTKPTFNGYDYVKSYAQAIIKKRTENASQVGKVENVPLENVNWKNNLRSMFLNKKVHLYAMIMRTFNAKDTNGNGYIDVGEQHGTFRNAVERLDEIKSLGINTFHVLPINPPGIIEAMGNAGSVYAPYDILAIDPLLGKKDDLKYFVNECHKRGISVMIDLPSCASVDLFKKRPDLMAMDHNKMSEIPQGWKDIRMFAPYIDEDKNILNKNLIDYHKNFVDLMIECKVDGIRADVARAKPPEFWDEIISYARSKDPEFAFLGETYVYEDASPMLNMPYDRPKQLLNAGFDSYYGQYHNFPQWLTSKEFHENIIKDMEMFKDLPAGKSAIASFATHDDKSPMSSGGVEYCNMTTGLQNTLPNLNTYYVTGFESGDTYIYPYNNQPAPRTLTHKGQFEVHEEKLDIFNLSRRPGGNHPEIGQFVKYMTDWRNKNEDLVVKGSYIPVTDTGNEEDSIIAYIRHYKGKTLLVVANRDVNANSLASIKIPGLKANQVLKDMAMPYGKKSSFGIYENTLKANIAPGRFHMFELDIPNIEQNYPQSQIYRIKQ